MRKLIGMIIAVLVAAAIAAGAVAVSYTHSDDYTSDSFPEGITVNGLDCSGLTYTKAAKELGNYWNGQKMVVIGNLDEPLAEYTDFGCKFSLNLALLMMLATLTGLVYTAAVWFAGNPVSGWTTMMSVLTMGLTGVFAVLAIVMKYLTLIIRLFVNRQSYLVESIKKV